MLFLAGLANLSIYGVALVFHPLTTKLTYSYSEVEKIFSFIREF